VSSVSGSGVFMLFLLSAAGLTIFSGLNSPGGSVSAYGRIGVSAYRRGRSAGALPSYFFHAGLSETSLAHGVCFSTRRRLSACGNIECKPEHVDRTGERRTNPHSAKGSNPFSSPTTANCQLTTTLATAPESFLRINGPSRIAKERKSR
jgi:hypothetical protein